MKLKSLRQPKTFLKKGFWTSKNFLLRWFLLSFFFVPLCVTLWLKLGSGFWKSFWLENLQIY